MGKKTRAGKPCLPRLVNSRRPCGSQQSSLPAHLKQLLGQRFSHPQDEDEWKAPEPVQLSFPISACRGTANDDPELPLPPPPPSPPPITTVPFTFIFPMGSQTVSDADDHAYGDAASVESGANGGSMVLKDSPGASDTIGSNDDQHQPIVDVTTLAGPQAPSKLDTCVFKIPAAPLGRSRQREPLPGPSQQGTRVSKRNVPPVQYGTTSNKRSRLGGESQTRSLIVSLNEEGRKFHFEHDPWVAHFNPEHAVCLACSSILKLKVNDKYMLSSKNWEAHRNGGCDAISEIREEYAKSRKELIPEESYWGSEWKIRTKKLVKKIQECEDKENYEMDDSDYPLWLLFDIVAITCWQKRRREEKQKQDEKEKERKKKKERAGKKLQPTKTQKKAKSLVLLVKLPV